MLRSLTPLQEISYYIDLIPGSTLPNKVAYKLKQQQNEEMIREIEELLQLGSIGKSPSPCVVPIAIAPKKE